VPFKALNTGVLECMVVVQVCLDVCLTVWLSFEEPLKAVTHKHPAATPSYTKTHAATLRHTSTPQPR
jgi:hypothetical protein